MFVQTIQDLQSITIHLLFQWAPLHVYAGLAIGWFIMKKKMKLMHSRSIEYFSGVQDKQLSGNLVTMFLLRILIKIQQILIMLLPGVRTIVKYGLPIILLTVRLLDDVTGQQVQVSNGTTNTNMYCITYEHNTGVPYYFERSNNLDSYYQSHKITNNFFSSGREGIVTVDSSEFYFALGDIEVDGQTINFIEIPDTLDVNNLNSINQCLITETITLSDNSSFLYSVQYGLNDSVSAVQAITGDRFINFKVLLIDDVTGQTIGEYDDVTYTQNNLYQYNNISYQVNTQGIGNRTARLKLVLDNNFESEYSLSRIFANESVLGKTTIKQISYSGGEVIKSYELSQNYPNPFNPTTTIKFQIPKAGNVTLKIYDILGNEITTLVDEFKEVGKFEVNFNASSLASGVYIYRLNVNDYVNVNKMVLLK
ncbi:MAG: T9SS C-terminal target domain-containing protein [Ignavibacteriae bacterium]|nr:MAG: T9SS C-terminal target domain-containing protein [Chlorobiota bacterium]MBL1122950.1 T9SS C-terminal target domain-containing protein [Ignavibacteriota bacterium]MCE7857513.1 T9SS C-terminal target domain-containing protein [Ignavibacteria bacterium CHB3]